VQQLLGNPAEASLSAQRAFAADAYLADASAIVMRLFNTSLDLKRYAEAADWCGRGRRTFPKEWVFLTCQVSLMAWAPQVTPDVGKAWGIMAELDTAASPDVRSWARPEMNMIVAAVLARAGLHDSAERVIARAKTAGEADPEILYYEVQARVRLNQTEEAARLLQEVIRRTPNLLPSLRSNPLFTSLWNDPRLKS
jgi:hypothetical protein